MSGKKNEEKRIGTGKPGPGRPKGSTNKIDQDLRRAAHDVLFVLRGAPNEYGDCEEGVVPYLAKVSESDPKAFLTFMGKFVSSNVSVDAGTIGDLMSAVSARVKQKSDGEGDE